MSKKQLTHDLGFYKKMGYWTDFSWSYFLSWEVRTWAGILCRRQS